MTPAPASPRVAVEPLRRCLPGFLRVMAPWSLVVVGRRVCVVAQRVPPVVRLVRWTAASPARRLWTTADADGAGPPRSAPWSS